MILTIYEGTTLLSVSYCNRKLKTLNERNTLAHIRGYDITMGTFARDPELQLLTEAISYYRNIKEKLKSDFAKVDEDELISFITKQMVIKIKESKSTKVSISFLHVSEYTVNITIDNIFSTELTLKRKVYEECWYPNEHYDGYNDTAEFVCSTRATSFLENIISTMKKELHSQLPNVLINYS